MDAMFVLSTRTSCADGAGLQQLGVGLPAVNAHVDAGTQGQLRGAAGACASDAGASPALVAAPSLLIAPALAAAASGGQPRRGRAGDAWGWG